jgi:hypothetical protein
MQSGIVIILRPFHCDAECQLTSADLPCLHHRECVWPGHDVFRPSRARSCGSCLSPLSRPSSSYAALMAAMASTSPSLLPAVASLRCCHATTVPRFTSSELPEAATCRKQYHASYKEDNKLCCSSGLQQWVTSIACFLFAHLFTCRCHTACNANCFAHIPLPAACL